MPLWPIILYFGLVLVVVTGMIGLSYILGQRHKEKTTDEPYESGMPTTGSARGRLSALFYLMAMFFVVFDLEAAFLYAYAVSARQVGWVGYIEAVSFIVTLLAALVYLWKSGALDWGGSRRKPGGQP
jgi:NADH-quinone oxidoreductase subunit A